MNSMFLAFLARRKYELYYEFLLDERSDIEKERDPEFREKKGAYEEFEKILEALSTEDKEVVENLFESLKVIFHGIEAEQLPEVGVAGLE